MDNEQIVRDITSMQKDIANLDERVDKLENCNYGEAINQLASQIKDTNNQIKDTNNNVKEINNSVSKQSEQMKMIFDTITKMEQDKHDIELLREHSLSNHIWKLVKGISLGDWIKYIVVLCGLGFGVYEFIMKVL